MSILDEFPCPLHVATDYFPKRNGRAVHPSTLRRWAKLGANGVRLEAVRIGRFLMTSREAVGRFLAATNGH